jgi:ribonuclease P protein component
VAESSKLFPREERLRKRREYIRVYERGARFKTRLFFIYLLENGLPYSRLGVTVSRKVGKTVVRNQLKRRFREVFRKNKRLVSPPSDLVINTSAVTAKAPFARLEEEFRKVFLSEDRVQDKCVK